VLQAVLAGAATEGVAGEHPDIYELHMRLLDSDALVGEVLGSVGTVAVFEGLAGPSPIVVDVGESAPVIVQRVL
jgi:hypothetical protein